MDELKRRLEVSRWIAEDFAGTLTDAQRAALDAWREESAGQEEEYQELRREWQTNPSLYVQTQQESAWQQWEIFRKHHLQKHHFRRNWYRYAALFLFLLGTGIFIRFQERMVSPNLTRQEIRQAEGHVRLILSNGKSLVLGDSLNIFSEEGRAEIRVEDRMIIYRQEKIMSDSEAYNTLIVPRGGEYRIALADGSVVWLNAETEFRYPVCFTGKERKVCLKGEAYFEVAANKDQPFVVEAAKAIRIKVLGTKFNVTSYGNEEDIVTTLAEGSVEVSDAGSRLRIRPDEQLLYHREKQSFRTRIVDAKAYIAWKDGKFVFEDQPLGKIMQQLQRWYEMEVFYTDPAVKDYRFSGDLKRYDSFDRIVKMLEEVAGLKIHIKDKCVVIGTE